MAARQTYLWNNVTLTPEQIAQVVRQAGITDPNTIAQFVSIATAESNGRAGVQGSSAPQASVQGDRGLFQINYVHDRALMNAGIIRQPSDLFDPVINARATAFLSGNGNPSTMRQLWGAAGGTWTGSSGGLPAPNYGAVNRANSQGLFNTAYTPGGTGGTLRPGAASAAQNYYNQQIGDIDASFALNQALTQSQAGYNSQQAGFANQMAGYQQQGLDLQRQQLGLENQYQTDLARLNQGLTSKQSKANLKDWQQIAANIGKLQGLAKEGLTQDKTYRDATVQLETDINDTAKKWSDQQKGFNDQDYGLAMEALQNVLTTEAAKWTETQRSTGVEQGLSGAKLTQVAEEATFAEQQQTRRRSPTP